MRSSICPPPRRHEAQPNAIRRPGAAHERPGRWLARTAALVLAASFAPLPAAAQSPQERAVPQARAEVLLSFSPVVKRAQPAVVNVYASRTDPRPTNPLFDDPIFRRFFGDGGQDRPGGPTAQSLGSGVLVDPAGLVVTNNHVIEGMTDVKIALSDKREFEATIVLRDARTDLAVLKLKGGATFPVMELGDSDTLEVGDMVLAMGNPFGVGQTVTQGIVSALARTQIGISDYGFFIQTDAAINPGNSGGPLVDMHARMVGINSAIFSKSGGSVGIGFAIPVNTVKTVVAAAKSGGKSVKRPWLGASLQSVSKEIADTLGLDRPSGALVADLTDKSPAAEAGLKRGDVITSIDGQPIEDPEGLGYRFGTKPLGGTASFAVLRGGKKVVAPVRLTPAPEVPARDPVKIKGTSPFSGATVINLSPAVAEEFSIEMATLPAGAVVAEIEDGSTAADISLQKGDVVVAVNDTKIASTRDLEKATEGARRRLWKVAISRGGQVITSVLGG
jgi:Do/DeqQ family serine protease